MAGSLVNEMTAYGARGEAQQYQSRGLRATAELAKAEVNLAGNQRQLLSD